MTPEIIRLLELRPDADFRAIRKAYKKRRREIDPLNTGELERLDAAYAEAMKQKRSAGYSDEQISAMRFLGIVPGCSLKTAIKFARNNGLDETEIQTAAGILEPVMPKVSVKDIVLAVLWTVLAWLPVLLARPLYLMIQKSGIDLFPGHSDPELAEWFSGTLTASVTVSILFTITVPLLAFFLWKKVRTRKRLFRKLGVRPGAESQVHDLLAELNIFFFCAALAISTYGPGFYRNAGNYLADYRAMKNETYLSAHIFTPEYAVNYYSKFDIMGRAITDGDGLVLDVRDKLYDNGTNSYVHEATYQYLPHTKLVREVKVDSWRLNEGRTSGAIPQLNRSLELQSLYYIQVYDTSLADSDDQKIATIYLPDISLTPITGVHITQYCWSDGQHIMILLSCIDETVNEWRTAALVLNEDGTILHQHIFPNKAIREAFMMPDGDVILYTHHSKNPPSKFASKAQAVHLSGKDLSLIAETEKPVWFDRYNEIEFKNVSEDGMEVTVGYRFRHDDGSETLREKQHFLPLP
ncbi:MAG: hypothetical protein IJD13_05730 [Oscillospiraceae bacterium]|nr:hypothetical protein [Oscillospiraceae bacterium]